MAYEPLAPELPDWTHASPGRREHMARVGALMEEWAIAFGLDGDEVARWRRTGLLHDCLRDARPEDLRRIVPPQFRDLPDAALHGPAAAERLGGSIDSEMADAIRFHTLGYSGWKRLGRALYLADYLEPGRKWDPEGKTALRARVPAEFDAVLTEVVAQRLTWLITQRKPVHLESVALWNRIVEPHS